MHRLSWLADNCEIRAQCCTGYLSSASTSHSRPQRFKILGQKNTERVGKCISGPHMKKGYTTDVWADKICPFCDWALLPLRDTHLALLLSRYQLYATILLCAVAVNVAVLLLWPFWAAKDYWNQYPSGIILNVFVSPGQRRPYENNSFKRDGALR